MALLFVDNLPQNKNRVLRTVIKALELLFLSIGLVSTLVMVKGAVVPYSCEIVFSSLVGFWNSIKCFFSSSLYNWIIINFIFMIIASSFVFKHRENDDQDDELEVSTFGEVDLHIAESPAVSPPPAPPPSPPPRDLHIAEYPAVSPPPRDLHIAEYPAVSPPPALPPRDLHIAESPAVSPPPAQPPSPPPRDVTEVYEEEDTMEATWKAIIGGEKERPKRKHLKKSETWDLPPRRTAAAVQRLDSEEVVPSTPKWKELRKAVTFNDAVSITRRGGLRRDPSMSVDEFNKQVEAFIKKFNDSMRLERQESNQRYLDMIGRGI